jgi:DNA-binding beta-propeller fold protein YncE
MPQQFASAILVLWLCGLLPSSPQAMTGQTQSDGTSELRANDLQARIERSPRLAFTKIRFVIHAPNPGWELGAVSGVAASADGTIYLIQRGDKADPIIALNAQGNVLRSWGKGDFTLPHSIRLDPKGNLWAVDAGSSLVIKYSATGKRPMPIAIGDAPDNQGPFSGATDIAFGPDGHIFITDGYANSRVLEYAADGKQLKRWGKPGNGAGEFHLPHSIQIDDSGTVFVADRENGRVERFTRDGHYLGSIDHLGRCYALQLFSGTLWATLSPLDQDPGVPGWFVKLDPKTGKILGHVDVPDPRQGHAFAILPSGEPILTGGNGLLWFRTQ